MLDKHIYSLCYIAFPFEGTHARESSESPDGGAQSASDEVFQHEYLSTSPTACGGPPSPQGEGLRLANFNIM